MADLPNPAFLMGVQGPLARTAGDLELLFDVLARPDIGEEVGWQLNLPPARHTALSDFRVAVIPAVLDVHCSSQMRAKLDELAALLRDAGATVEETLPGFDMAAYFQDYARLLNAMVTQAQPREEREAQAERLRAIGDDLATAQADGLVLDAHEYLALINRRQAAIQAWRTFFADWDVVIAPTALDSAYPHQTGDFEERELIVDNVSVPYFANIVFPMLAIFAGLPATAFPAGLDNQGLPLGLQAIGPYLEDRTTLKFAQLVEQAWGGFVPPPDYA